jgi:hypothetical protein
LSGDIRTTWSVKKIALVTTTNYLDWMMWATLKRGTVWDEDLAVGNSAWLCRTK